MENSRPRFRAWDQRDYVKHYWYEDDVCTHGDIWNIGHMEGNSIEQFTGLYDKNGKEIFEGDIVHLDTWEGNQQIAFIEGAFCLADHKGEYVGDIHYIHHANHEQASVIGNIHQNPEILDK